MVVAKRLAPRAVTRNLVKRIARDIFRKAELKAVDCIVRLSQPMARRPQSAATRQLRDALHTELARLLQSPSAAIAANGARP